MTQSGKSGFSLNPIQTLFSLFLVLILIGLSIPSITSASRAVKLSDRSVNAISQLQAATEVKREIFLYDIGFGQWTTGHIPVSILQNSRTTLLRSLGVSKKSGRSIAEIGNKRLADLLQGADLLIAEAGPGYLSIALQDKFLLTSLQILNGLTSVARSFDAPYGAAVQSLILGTAKTERSNVRWTWFRFLLRAALTLCLFLWIAMSFRKQHKRSQKEALVSTQSLERIREELSEAHETVLALQKINESKTDFVTTLNHELRTPLTSIIGYVDILKDFTAVSNDREFHKYLSVMDRNALILNEIIESILFLSALDNQQTLPQPTVVDLVDICEAAVADQNLAIKSAHLKVRTNYDETEYYSVLGSKNLLTQVFANFISNAIKFSPEKSRIDVLFNRYTDQSGEELIRVEVKDQGFGIPANELPNLFTKFFRASNALENEIPGTGLGLAIVKRIIELHQGTVSVQSLVGQGTSMIVELPFAMSSLEELVKGKRQEVLERAITAISEGQVESLMAITHDMGGAIGFYTYKKESEKLIQLSRWLEKNPDVEQAVVAEKRKAILDLLNNSLELVKKGGGPSGG